MKFTVDHLPDVRRCVASHARKAGLGEDHVGDFVVAVNEVATNAVRYGSADADLRLWVDGGEVVAEVCDQGDWHPKEPPGKTAPGPDSEGGMGLWVTRLICSAVHITTGRGGTVVRLHMALP
jgi:serine/threonine-protein kinase RsbW